MKMHLHKHCQRAGIFYPLTLIVLKTGAVFCKHLQHFHSIRAISAGKAPENSPAGAISEDISVVICHAEVLVNSNVKHQHIHAGLSEEAELRLFDGAVNDCG